MSFLDQFQLERVLSERGPVVTRLMTRADGVRVVVKTLSVRATRDAREVTLFEREAGILKHLEHPAVPRFLDFSVEERAGGDVLLHLVQSHVDGKSLDAWIKDGRSFSAAEAKDIMRALAQVLCVLHGTSPPLVHRDIKPSNVMRDNAGEIFLVDFGAAKRASRDGTAVGTFGYMAPEQMEGRASAASDVFGVGMTMVHLLTHLEPEAFADDGGVRKSWRKRANVDEPFAQLINDCIALDESQRPQDGVALRARIDGLSVRPAPRPVRPAASPTRNNGKVVAVAAAFALVLGMMGFALFLIPNKPPATGSVTADGPNPTPAMPWQAPKDVPASEHLGVPGLIEATDCLSRSERALQSEQRYRSWRKGDDAPTCTEPYLSYGLYSLYQDAPESCRKAAQAATSSTALHDATQALAAALTTATATVAQAESYYDAEDYKDDGCAKAKLLHARLLPEFAAVRTAFARVMEARTALAKRPPPQNERLRAFRRVLDAALALDDAALPVAQRRPAVDALERAIAEIPKDSPAGREFNSGISIENLRKWARDAKAVTPPLSAGDVTKATANGVEDAVESLMRPL